MKERYLPPVLIQTVGLILLVGASAFWVVTGHESALLVGAALTLIGIGAYSGIVVGIRRAAAPPVTVHPREEENQKPFIENPKPGE